MMDFDDKLAVGSISTMIALGIFAVVGWVANVIQLVHMVQLGDPLSTYMVLKILGVFMAPFGTILGYIGMF